MDNKIAGTSSSGKNPNSYRSPDPKIREKSYKGLKIAMIITAVFVFITGGLYAYLNKITLPTKPFSKNDEYRLEKFESEEEFREYTKEVSENFAMFGSFLTAPSLPGVQEFDSSDFSLGPAELRSSDGVAERVSQTNVQVAGIDEPDILKTNGKEIFLSRQQRFYIQEQVFDDTNVPARDVFLPPDRRDDAIIQLINAYPPSDLSEITAIKESGEMLLTGDTLVIFSDDNRNIYGYDITKKTNPRKKWDIGIDDEVNSSLVTARLLQKKVYLVTRTNNNPNNPCPIPITRGSARTSIPCTEIYHPAKRIRADSTYTIMVLDPDSGSIEDKISFVGTAGQSIVYMSEKNIYVAYPQPADFIQIFSDFFSSEGKDLLPEETVTKINALKQLEISETAKHTEFGVILVNYTDSLNRDERLKFENEMEDKLSDYVRENIRDLYSTGIAKISVNTLDIKATGSVPGNLLNQFAMDEYEGYLRVATTLSGGFAGSGRDSSNEVIVLDQDLNETGSVRNLGLEERIYSVRFIEDKGYLVTFRQIDPFYVLDLSDPRSPRRVGELKIPGYSSYLHQLEENRILGVGKEGSKVKLSLFDVFNPANPREIDKYELDEFWSEILSTHKAFLADPKFGVFFVPGGKGGYVFSYKNGSLSLVKAISDYQVKRALFLDDYLYIVGEQQISVLDQNTYDVIKRLDI